MTIVILILLVIIISNLIVTQKIKLADYENEERRRIHILMVWIIPILGIWMTQSFWKKPSGKIEVITKKDRKVNPGGFYDSGHGTHGEYN